MKKISSIVLTAVIGLGALLPAAGCGDKSCQHNVGEWEVKTPATCTATGVQEGICGVCLEKVTQEIPVNPENHLYGEWSITAMPTEENKGSALKTCTENGAHTLELELPNLANVDYVSEITTRPTAAKDGERSYTLKHDAGDVVFTQPVPATGVQTLRDAVDLGSSAESKELIRSAEGTMGHKFYEEGTLKVDLPHTHKYEFGDKYTHIVDGTDSCERWYFTDADGEVYGLTDYSDGTTSAGVVVNDLKGAGNEKYLDGSRLYLQYANNLGSYYGLESLLEGLYRTARWSNNGDFREWSEEVGEETVYHFFFGSVQNSGSDSGYFAQVEVSFTLTSLFTIDSLVAEATIYVNNAQQGEGSVIKTWELNDKGYAQVVAGGEEGTRYVSTIDFTQTLKAPEDVLPVNPHALDKIYVQSFDIQYYDEVLGEGDYAEFAAGEEINTGYIFKIANVQPTDVLTNYAMDSFSFHLRTKNENGETVDLPINEFTISTTGMTAYMDTKNYSFFLRAQRAGEQTVVVKSRFAEKEIHCKIAEEAPRALYPTFYRYQNGEYSWEYKDRTTVSVGNTSDTNKHYVHQPFYFTADVPLDQINYASSAYTYEIRKGITGSGGLVNAEWVVATSIDRRAVVQFTPAEAGAYQIKLISKIDSTISSQITLTVTNAPTFEAITNKTYIGSLEYPNYTDATVAFAERTEILDENQAVIGYRLTATVTLEDNSFQVLSCEYDVAERTLTSAHSSGNQQLGFVLSLNEGYDLVLSHLDGFGGWERVTLIEK